MVKVGQYVLLDTQGEENSGLMTSFVAAALVASALQSGFPEEVKAVKQGVAHVVEMVRPLPSVPAQLVPRNG